MATPRAHAYRIVIIPGDGIGREVIPAVGDVLRTLVPSARFVEAEAGFGAYERYGTPLPDATLAACRDADAILFGAVTTPPDIPGYRSPILRLRKELGLAANLRPVRSLPIPASRPGVDLLIVRENTEGMYSGIEEVSDDGERAITLRVITGAASRRVAHTALRLARTRRSRCTVVHKANVLRQTDGLFRRAVREVAAEYPDVTLDELLVDTAALRLVQQPEAFDVLVTTNLFGDILSDLAAAHIGGLGVAASANVGDGKGLFEPVHGSAPDIAGRGIANPTATFLASVLMLRHLGEDDAATRLERATEATLAAGIRTPDLGGAATMLDVCRAVSAAL
ncbi:MAG: isocitrate/isopropylmalate dehydrogenase family protein [Thermomicrobiales bacterium]